MTKLTKSDVLAIAFVFPFIALRLRCNPSKFLFLRRPLCAGGVGESTPKVSSQQTNLAKRVADTVVRVQLISFVFWPTSTRFPGKVPAPGKSVPIIVAGAVPCLLQCASGIMPSAFRPQRPACPSQSIRRPLACQAPPPDTLQPLKAAQCTGQSGRNAPPAIRRWDGRTQG